MTTFQRITKLNTLITGSLVTTTGSEYLFGFDASRGLKWLERHGFEYGPSDEVWAEAEQLIRIQAANQSRAIDPIDRVPEEETAVQVRASENEARPKTVSRSVAAGEYALPQVNDPRIVGDTSTEGRDIPDDDISSQAEAFLRGLDGPERLTATEAGMMDDEPDEVAFGFWEAE